MSNVLIVVVQSVGKMKVRKGIVHLKGKIVGKYTLIKEVENKIFLSGRKERRWQWSCTNCGRLYILPMALARKGKKCPCEIKPVEFKPDIERSKAERKKIQKLKKQLKKEDSLNGSIQSAAVQGNDASRAQRVLNLIKESRCKKEYKLIQVDKKTWVEREVKKGGKTRGKDK